MRANVKKIPSPQVWRESLVIQAARGPSPFGKVMAQFQRDDFTVIDKALLALAKGEQPEPGRIFLERTKGSSKDTDIATCILWLLAFSPRPLDIQVGAADRDQADEVRKAAKDICRLNPALAKYIQILNWTIVNKQTESTCTVLAADSTGGAHGARPHLLLMNEVSHISKEEFAKTLLDNASKMPNGVVILMSNAGFQPSWQWDLRELARTSDRWYFSSYTKPAPWLDPRELEEARKRNSPARYARLWDGCVWTRGMGDALSAEDIQASITLPGPSEFAREDAVHFMGVDIGVSRDHTGICVVSLHASGQIQLTDVRSWAPSINGKVNLSEVRDAIIDANKRYGLMRVYYDPWNMALMADDLAALGVPMQEFSFTSGNLTQMATVVLERFTTHRVQLYQDDNLIRDLHSLRLLDKGTSYRLDFPRDSRGHGDRGTAFCLALVAAEQNPCMPWTPESIRSGGRSVVDRMPCDVFMGSTGSFFPEMSVRDLEDFEFQEHLEKRRRQDEMMGLH